MDRGRDIAVDTDGDAYVTGTACSDAGFAPSPTVYTHSAGSSFLSKLNSYGDLLWAVAWGADEANGVATGALGDVAVAGSFEGVVDFDPGPETDYRGSMGSYDLFVARMPPDGYL